MRWKALAAAGTAALLLSGCSQPEPAPTPVPVPVPIEDSLPSHPAQEKRLGSIEGFSSATQSSRFRTENGTAAAYLACGAEGELRLTVSGTAPATVPCGTKENPTRMVYENLPRGAEHTVTVEPLEDAVSFALVLTNTGQ